MERMINFRYFTKTFKLIIFFALPQRISTKKFDYVFKENVKHKNLKHIEVRNNTNVPER